MYSRCCAAVSACISIFAIGESIAQTAPPGILVVAHHDWVGHAKQSVTRNGSVLSEYTAETKAVNMEGAQLSVSMIPRFGCVPIVSLSVNDPAISSKAVEVELTVGMDSRKMDFPAIVDREGSEVRFTLNTAVLDQKKWRSIVDLASWASFEWSLEANVPVLSNASTEGAISSDRGNIDFSLLGSQRTVEDMEAMCRSHTPLPLTN